MKVIPTGQDSALELPSLRSRVESMVAPTALQAVTAVVARCWSRLTDSVSTSEGSHSILASASSRSLSGVEPHPVSAPMDARAASAEKDLSALRRGRRCVRRAESGVLRGLWGLGGVLMSTVSGGPVAAVRRMAVECCPLRRGSGCVFGGSAPLNGRAGGDALGKPNL